MRRLFLFLIISIVAINVQAQAVDSMMRIYADEFPQEKMHIHFDKSMYAKGETIWYKAYVFADIFPSEISNNVYVDWFDAQGKLLSHTYYPIFKSSIKGSFSIPETYTGNVLQVKAYTKWMLNFDTAFLFKKQIPIFQGNEKQTNLSNTKSVLQFFPEGGNLVANTECRLAFLAHNGIGLPVQIRGAIFENGTTQLDSFATQYDGMGLVSVKLQPQKLYTAQWIDENNKTYTDTLPEVLYDGITLQVQPLNDKVVFVVKRTPDAAANFQSVNVVAHINQHLVYRSKINFSSIAARAEFSTKEFPSGVLQITVFDNEWKPTAERVVFINNNNHISKVDVKVIEKKLLPRSKNKLEVFSLENEKQNLSIAVVDADLYHDSTFTIMGQVLLSADCRGYIHQAGKYFRYKPDSLKSQLDLVMLTHGWRRYKWTDVLNGKTPKLINPLEPDAFVIRGKVFGQGYLQATPNPTITLILQGKDSSNNMFSLPISRSGDFTQSGIFFFDTAKVFYQLSGEKSKTELAAVTIKNGLLPAHKNATASAYHFFSPFYRNSVTDSLQLVKQVFFEKERNKLDKLLKAQQLDEVTVQTKVKSVLEKLDQQYATGAFSSSNAYQFDVGNDLVARSMMTVFNYLQGRVAGLQITTSGSQASLSWRGSVPDLYLNEMRTDVAMVGNIPMSDVAYIKVFRPPFFGGSSGGGGGGAIAIYTKKGGSSSNESIGKGLSHVKLPGYTFYKEFYNPVYDGAAPTNIPDVRTTLYWNPYLLTDSINHVVPVEFYNNDNTKRFRVIVEGVSESGKLIRVDKIIQ